MTQDRAARRFLVRLTLAFLAAAVPVCAMSQPAPASLVPQVSASSGQSDNARSGSFEIALLKAQLEDQRKFQDQLLSTVHWSLGTLASLAALLVGFGWFANFRMYERDKAALQTDLRAHLSEEVRGASDSAAQVAVSRFAEQDAHLSKKLSTYVDQLNAAMKTQGEDTEKKSAARAASIASRLDKLKRDVLDLQLASTLQERQSWVDKKIYRNALQLSVNSLQFANEIAWDNTLAEVLDFVAQDMSAIIEQKARPIDNYLVAQLVAALDAVKGTHAHAAAGLKAKAGDLLNA